jgi:hypothetical protein
MLTVRQIVTAIVLLGVCSLAAGQSKTAGTGTSVMACAGFPPNPCAPTHLAVTTDASGNATNGAYANQDLMTVGQPAIDPFFGERMVRITDVNSNGGTFSTPEAGWVQMGNCAGTPQSASCASSPYHMIVAEGSVKDQVFSINPATLALTRIDQSAFTGGGIADNHPLEWASTDPNRLYTMGSGAQASFLVYWEFTPATPSMPTPVTFLVPNAGPLGASGQPNNAALLNGMLTTLNLPVITGPYVCDGTTCTPSGGPASTCGVTANCIQVSTTGGSLSGKVNFTFTEDGADIAGILHEQNIAGCSSCKASYTFTAGTGSITSLSPPNRIVSPVTAVNWHLYAETINGAWVNTFPMALDQCDGAYSGSSTCSFPLTSIATVVSTAHHMNQSCETYTTQSPGCYVGMLAVSKDDTKFLFMTGAIGQGYYEIVGLWDTTKGLRWLDLTTGQIHNGATDAAGNACPSANCWSAPTGSLNWNPDPNDPGLKGSSYEGYTLHEVWISLDGRYAVIQNGASQTENESNLIWDTTTANVYATSLLGTASNTGGHNASGYGQQITVAGPTTDGEFGVGEHPTSTSTSLPGMSYPGVIGLLNQNASNLGGPCVYNSGSCTYPTPSAQTSGVAYYDMGLSRRNVHYSWVNDTPSDTMPFLAISYLQGSGSTNLLYSIATSANSGASRACVSGVCTDTFKATGTGYISFLPFDQISISGVTDTTFNNTCIIPANDMTWSAVGTMSFSCPSSAAGIAEGNATSGGGTMTKTDLRPARALENEIWLNSTDGSGKRWRVAHECFGAWGSNSNTGPNGTVSQDGHYALETCYDGTRSDVVIVELR